MLEKLSRSEAPLIVLLFSMLVLLILPVPAFVLDFLIGLNICATVILMVTAIHLSSPLQFSSFPAILLVTTLFRLALSVATTRQILLTGDAGHVVTTFGQFVAGGNLAVGLIVFLILTIVQFLVITKGAERVAEVGARFALDGMPGKQMAIDGDMRAGMIDGAGASLRRATLEQETKFYGAMDGAMKFVKGDAIAGLIIVLINLVGGISIGVSQHGMALAEALSAYAILTIGDGLVGQIPALLIAVSAGMIVTRVSDQSKTSNAGRDFASQFVAEPRALFVGGGGVTCFGFMPGMPTLTFCLLGGAVIAGAFYRRKRAGGAPGVSAAEDGAGATSQSASEVYAFSVPISVQVAQGILLKHPKHEIELVLKKTQHAISRQLGMRVPDMQCVTAADGGTAYTIFVHEVPVMQGELNLDDILVLDAGNRELQILSLPLKPVEQKLSGRITAWVDGSYAEILRKLAIRHVQGLDVLVLHLEAMVVRHSVQMLGIQETHALLEALAGTHPDLIRELRRVMPEQRVAEVLQRLVAEKVSIRNLRLIVESLIQWGGREKDVVVLTEYVRVALCHQISYRCTGGTNLLVAYLLSEKIESDVRDAIRQTSGGNFLQMEGAMGTDIVAAVRDAIQGCNQTRHEAILLTGMEIRRYVRKLIETEMPWVEVVAFQELTQDVQIQPVARIQLA